MLFIRFFSFSILFLFILPFSFAQTVTLNPLSVSQVGDADEFFTDVWGQPKDFDDTCDMGTDASLFEPRGVSNGIWEGVHPEIAGPSLQVIQIPVPGTQLAYRENCSKLGLQVPIDASKYTNLSYKLMLTSTSSYSVLWSKENNFSTQGIADFDGYFLPEAGINTPANVWSIKNLDMPAIDDEITWEGEITGLTIWPSYFQPAGGTIKFDWVRIIDPSTSPTVNISWTSAGSSSSPTNDSVTLYIDDNNSGFDGVPIQRFLNTSGNINLPTGFLPPGTYYFYVSFDTHNRQQTTVVDFSAYSGAFVINGKPSLQFTAPSRTSGPEYARDELSDPWDMNGPGDLENLFNTDGSEKTAAEKGFNSFNFNEGYFEATTDEDVEGFTVDTQVHMNVPSNRPVDTNFYRYFCYSMQVDTTDLTRDGNAVELNRAGLVARLVYARGSIADGGGSTFAHELLERSQTYRDPDGGFVEFCIDLWDDTAFETGVTWRQAGYASVVRFDPLEASYPTKFSIASAGLYAENQASSSGSYSIEWEALDPENDSLSISLYYDSDNSGYDGTLIETINGQSVGAGQYSWDTSAVPVGSYYVYAVISDGQNSNRYYSDVVVNVAAVTGVRAPSAGAPCDTDGDGKSDFTVVRGPVSNANATWFTLKSSNFTLRSTEWGSRRNDIFVGGDFDGDRISDVTFIRARINQFIDWWIQPTETLGPYSSSWGLLGDIPVVADIDGDFKDELMIFRPESGDWWSIRSSLGFLTIQWGLRGDIPTPADYDGDNWDDIAIWRPSDGYWWILQSSRGASRAPADVLYRQWGLPGDHPMPGDYDGDGRADLVVWRPTDGTWYICSSTTDFDCTNFTARQFGLPGDIPVKADFDGDEVLDIAVWRPSDGGWYYTQSSDNQFVFRQWGLFGDSPLCMGMLDTISNLPNSQ